MVSERPRQFLFFCLIVFFGMLYFILYHIEYDDPMEIALSSSDFPLDAISSSISDFNDDSYIDQSYLVNESSHILNNIQEGNMIVVLQDIDKADIRPRTDQSQHQIFFIETSHPEGANLELNERKACAIESAAFMHPNHKIFVIIAGNTTIDLSSNRSGTYVNLVNQYKNIFFRSMDPIEFMKGTPLENFHKWQLLKGSQNYNVYLADILRLVALWKYGGLYFDTDVVVLKNFEDLGENYLCVSSYYLLMSGTMQFSSNGFGHEVVEAFLKNAVNEFTTRAWASNGPSLVTRVMKRVCKANNTVQMNVQSCKGIKILRKTVFLPIDYTQHKWYFDPARAEKTVRKTKNSYTAHIFNHMNAKIELKTSEGAAYVRLAETHCPHVYEKLGEYFQ